MQDSLERELTFLAGNRTRYIRVKFLTCSLPKYNTMPVTKRNCGLSTFTELKTSPHLGNISWVKVAFELCLQYLLTDIGTHSVVSNLIMPPCVPINTL